jgi:hypothetical protein
MALEWIVVSPAAGITGAVAVLAVVRVKVKGVSWISPVDGGASWSPYDSWLTNVSALAGFAGTLWTVVGGLDTVVNSGLSASISVMFVVCGGSAAIAPLFYAALARKEATNTGDAIGTVAGLFLAAAVTLFASFGELGGVSLLVWSVNTTVGGRVAAGMVQALIVATASCVFVYSGRTLYSVIVQSAPGSATASQPAPGSATASQPAAARRPMSYLITAKPGTRRSATL